MLDVDTENERAIHVDRRTDFETVEPRGSDLRMRLPFDEPIAEAVQLPPSEIPSSAGGREPHYFWCMNSE
ncbi:MULTISPECIES: hypothetical protein [Natrialbaceae]|uniref:hypothetical protein n=1 Tax=Natrialbaceae TaxID=1644061 RepID=UPI00207CA235|nr:hypothetical protein [Natronococcus sp. CG52]